jgi:hypothetical protein
MRRDFRQFGFRERIAPLLERLAEALKSAQSAELDSPETGPGGIA